MIEPTSTTSLPDESINNNCPPSIIAKKLDSTSIFEMNNFSELSTDDNESVAIDYKNVESISESQQELSLSCAQSNDENESETRWSIATDENDNEREVKIINQEWYTQRSPVQMKNRIVDHNKNEIASVPQDQSNINKGDSNFINCNDVIVTENQTNNITYKEQYLCPNSLSQVSKCCSSRRCLITMGALALTLVLITVLCIWLTNRLPSFTIYPSDPSDSINTASRDTFVDDPNIPDVYTVKRIQWLAQPARQPAEKLFTSPASHVIIGQTETDFCFTQSQCMLHVRNIQFLHIESFGWNDIGYNFLVGGDGQIYEGRGWDVIGAHTKGYNSKSIGIGFIGTFNHVDPSDAQIYAAKKLIEYAENNNKVSKDYKLVGFRQIRNAEGSGEKLYDIIKTWDHWSPTP